MEPVTFVLFGATGDLAKRKIYPALYNLYIEQKLPPYFHVIGLGRREWTDDIFKSNVEQSIADFSRRKVKDPVLLKSFLNMFQYQTLDIGRQEDYERLLERIEKRENGLSLTPNRMFYLSVGPEFLHRLPPISKEAAWARPRAGSGCSSRSRSGMIWHRRVN